MEDEREDDRHADCRIKSVYFWQNGMAMVFCEHGQQMPDLQGPTAEMREAISARILAQGIDTVTIESAVAWRELPRIAGHTIGRLS